MLVKCPQCGETIARKELSSQGLRTDLVANATRLTWAVYCGSMQRFDPRVTAQDVLAAVEQFKENNDVAPRYIGLNPKSADLPAPEGIEVKIIGGCCQWEVWLSADDLNKYLSPRPSALLQPPTGTSCALTDPDLRKYTPEKYVHSKQPILGDWVDIFQSTPTSRRGPKSRELPDDKIRQLALEGLGSKAIAAKLIDAGINVSYRTIQRRLKDTQDY